VELETTFTGFANRDEGGRCLAKALSHYRDGENTIIVGLPRGGVMTASAVAEELRLPLEVMVVRKLGTPESEELAMGAIGSGGVRVLNEDVVSFLGITPEMIATVTRREQLELARREKLYRAQRPNLDLYRKTVIVVDDGLATGSSMAAAIAVIQSHHPSRIVLAVPVAPVEICERFRLAVDELVYLETPDPFQAVSYWYVDFSQVSDEDVVHALERADARAGALV
jgi:putative phosphoribosyl transferase